MSDASFHDADGHGPLALRAETPDELPILSALCQDAVLTVGDIRYDGTARSLALLVSRFRWEDLADREAVPDADRPYSFRWLRLSNFSPDFSRALVGMQPQFRQMPPRFSRSTMATFRPNWLARMAAT